MSLLNRYLNSCAIKVSVIFNKYGKLLRFDKYSISKFEDEVQLEWGYELTIPGIPQNSTVITQEFPNGFQRVDAVIRITVGKLDSMPPPPPSIPDDISILPGEIKQLYKKAKENCCRHESEKVYEKLEALAIKLIDDGWTTEKFDHEYRIKAVSHTGPDAHQIPCLLSIANCIHAENALEEGAITQAWLRILDARDWTSEKWIMAPRNTTQGELGGKAKSAKYFEPIKQELIKRLSELSPTGGWKSRPSAIRLLVDDLWKFVESKNLHNEAEEEAEKAKLPKRNLEDVRLTSANFENTLLKWMREDNDVQAAYRNNASKKLPT